MEPVSGEVICGAIAHLCICGLPSDHPGPIHECHREGCGGQWKGTLGEDDFEVVSFPVIGRIE